MKLAIITCANREPKWGYVQSMGAMEEHIRANGVLGKRTERMTRLVMRNCSLLPQGRQRTLDVALSEGFTHALMVDDDMEFPADIVDRLAFHVASPPVMLPLMAINYMRKGSPPLYTAVGMDGNILSSDGRTGVEQVMTCGLGLALLDLGMIRHIPRPHFEVLWNEHGDYEGEDCYFMKKLAANGVYVYIDHDASKLVGHIGDYSYGATGK